MLKTSEHGTATSYQVEASPLASSGASFATSGRVTLAFVLPGSGGVQRTLKPSVTFLRNARNRGSLKVDSAFSRGMEAVDDSPTACVVGAAAAVVLASVGVVLRTEARAETIKLVPKAASEPGGGPGFLTLRFPPQGANRKPVRTPGAAFARIVARGSWSGGVPIVGFLRGLKGADFTTTLCRLRTTDVGRDPRANQFEQETESRSVQAGKSPSPRRTKWTNSGGLRTP
jgi:hypothetical protein